MAKTHVLIVHEAAEMDALLQRAWIVLEIALRAASDKLMVILVDLSGQAVEYFSKAVIKKVGGLTRPETRDFFGNLLGVITDHNGGLEAVG